MFTPFVFPNLEEGHVWIAGAGPGHPGLLTLLTQHALARADVVVYDALVSQEILSMARKGARLLYAGKRGGRASLSQEDISTQLICLAKRHHKVLRLKGGDPFLFGRGVEEALALLKENIPFRVIPGVTSGSGGLTWAGIPLTYRETNSCVTFLTGHCAKDNGKIDWQALSKGAETLVVYMPLKNLGAISQKLCAAGRSQKEPVALVSKASTPEQVVLITDLEHCAQKAKVLQAPCLAVIGPNVPLYQQLHAKT